MSIHDSPLSSNPFLLLCDEMLIRLCHWVRAAGHDCAMLPAGSADREIMKLAIQESRLILTRDRQFLNYRNAEGRVIFLHTQVLDTQAQELSRALSIDWLYRPFSRCLVCNSALKLADQKQRYLHRVQLRDDEPLWTCPGCHRHYWAGSHVKRMQQRLEGWKQTADLSNKNGE